jgi:hypothetical protein
MDTATVIVYAEATPADIPGLVHIRAQDGRKWRDVTMAQAHAIVDSERLSLHVQAFGSPPRHVAGADPDEITLLF